jgi:uncharacterized phosphosugar-binding protein
MLYDDLFDALEARLARVRVEARETIHAAADLIVDSFGHDHRTFLFGSGHSALTAQDVCIRAGSLVFFNPIVVPGLMTTDHPFLRSSLLERVSGIAAAVLATAEVAAGDTLIVVSNSGRNAVPIEMATEGKRLGLNVIAVTGLETAASQPSRHESGRHLHDVADVTIDTCAPLGDAAVAIEDSPVRLGALSTVLGAAVVQALTAEVAELLLARGITPPIIASGNVDGSGSHNRDVLDRYRHLTTYLPRS